ncbi:unnamed protein product [Plutella xylostella]|uniref:(diamondback moth) hypothetical protein n=1 Tax=Plutella xylostella TaxID=51655 RepID=A0A8S4FKN9_PLUXY|nr:unnamed protein product [Plutella xylostella]
MVSANKKSSLCMGFGSVFVVMGAISVVFWPALFFAQLKNNMILTNVSESFGIWKETPIPMYLECFMWNITNMREILAGTAAKVEVNQMGPYVYRESHSKTNITFKDNGTVSFFNQRFWHYEPEMSNGSLSDRITSINPIVVSIAYMMRNERLILRPGVDAFLRIFHRNMFVTANVSSWLFDGIDDPVLDIAQNITEIDIPYDKFGWFYDRNGSETFDGQFLMDTGANDFSQLGNIVKWRNSNRTLYRDQCGEVKGSTGELWAPELGQPEVTIFAPDICTYMTLHKQGPYSTEGIDGVMYAANDSVFDNGYKYGSMACYCDEVRDNECLRPGALNVSSCRLGAPAFVSMPHFYNADPYYPSKIEGLDPVP